MWIVAVGYSKDQKDPLGENAKSDIIELGFPDIRSVKTLQTYVLEGSMEKKDIEKIGKELLADNVIQYFNFDNFNDSGKHLENIINERGAWVVEVFFKQGVMDPVGLSVQNAIDVLGIPATNVSTGTIYIIDGRIKEDELKVICSKYLANEMIHNYNYRRM